MCWDRIAAWSPLEWSAVAMVVVAAVVTMMLKRGNLVVDTELWVLAQKNIVPM